MWRVFLQRLNSRTSKEDRALEERVDDEGEFNEDGERSREIAREGFQIVSTAESDRDEGKDADIGRF